MFSLMFNRGPRLKISFQGGGCLLSSACLSCDYAFSFCGYYIVFVFLGRGRVCSRELACVCVYSGCCGSARTPGDLARVLIPVSHAHV